MEKATNMRLVYVTTDSFENAQHIARIVVTEKLAACVSIFQGAFSIFGWQDIIHQRHEYVLMMKSAKEKLDDLEHRVSELHVDEVPEIIAVPVDSASAPYLNWFLSSISEE